MARIRFSIVLFAAAAFFTRLSHAQSAGSATVSGIITDASGAVIPGASVVLRSPARGLERQTETGVAGIYSFPDVTPGRYDLRVIHGNFETYELSAFEVEVGQRATHHVTLRVGQVTTVVSVKAQSGAIELETESNAIGTVVDSKRVEELPLNGRNFLQLALLAGGSNAATGRADPGQIGHPGRVLVVGGNRASYTSYLINGIAVRGSRKGELAVNLSIANIDQFKVQQNFFMPDQGPNPGIVNVTTKGGTNQFHGQVFEFVRNVKFDARNFFAQGAENLKRNQFGGSFGGPIVRNRVWFYGGYEGLRQITGFVAGAYTPTSAMFSGDFREVSQVIYDPMSFSPATGQRTPFASNMIPDGRINPTSKQLLKYYIPGASLTQRPNNLLVNPRNTLDDDQFNIRSDAALTGRQTIFGQFIYSKSPAFEAGIFPLSGAAYPNETQVVMVQHTYTLSSSLVNTLRAGVSRTVSLFSNEGREAGDILTPLGIRNTNDVRGVTAQIIQGFTTFGRENGDLGNLDNTYQIDEGVNWINGSHQFRFGTGIRYYRTWQQNSSAGAVGNLMYQPNFTAQIDRNAAGQFVAQANTGNSFADYLLGLPVQGTTRGLPMLPYRYTQYMPYFQDTWKLTPKLTLNLGISWFKDTIANPQKQARDFSHGFDAATGLLKFAVLREINPRVIKLDDNNLAPRLGLAWQVTPAMVIRAGAGAYYAEQMLIDLQFAAVGPPFSRSNQLIVDRFNPAPFYVVGQNIFPQAPLPPIDANFAKNLPPTEAPFILNEEGRTPYINQWNLSVQQTLGRNNLIEAIYAGNGSHKLQNWYDFDQCRVTPTLECNRATRPYLNYQSLLRADFNGNASYHAFIAKYHGRTAAGVDLRLEYTWAKALLDNRESSGSSNSQISECRRCDKGYATFDTRHRAVAALIWDMPFFQRRAGGAGRRPLAEMALGGWTATAIATFQTGTPFLITTRNATGSPFIDHRPNRTCRGALDDPDIRSGRPFFDTTCFADVATGFFGNSSRAPLHGPGVNNWDLGIQKFFTIQEGIRLQFRGELFNAFNHVQFGNPTSDRSNSNFGLVGSSGTPRLVQLGLKLLF